jgi:hypothetical protein
MTCTAVHVTPNPNHVLSGTSAAVTEPAPGVWDLNTELVLSEYHPRSLESRLPVTCATREGLFPLSGISFVSSFSAVRGQVMIFLLPTSAGNVLPGSPKGVVRHTCTFALHGRPDMHTGPDILSKST